MGWGWWIGCVIFWLLIGGYMFGLKTLGKTKDMMWLYLHKEELVGKLFSRKLWATVVGAALLTLGQQLGLPESVYKDLLTLLMTYIAGQSAVDAAAALRKKE